MTRSFLAATFAITVSGLTTLADSSAFANPLPTDTAAKENSDQIVFRISQVNVGPGYTWGNGILSIGGEDYAIRVEGGGAPAIGYSKACAHGEVTGLSSADQLDSTFWAVHTEATAGGGTGSLVMQNSRGVELHLKTKTSGARLSAAAERLRFHVLGPSKTKIAAAACS